MDQFVRVLTVTWEPVTKNADGTPISDLAGYEVLRQRTFHDELERVISVGKHSTPMANIVVGHDVFLYTVKAIDQSDNRSESSIIVNSDLEPRYHLVSSDKTMTLTMTSAANELLLRYGNRLGVPLQLAFTNACGARTETTVQQACFEMRNSETGEIVVDPEFGPKARAILDSGSNRKAVYQLDFHLPRQMADGIRQEMTTVSSLQAFPVDGHRPMRHRYSVGKSSSTIVVTSNRLQSIRLDSPEKMASKHKIRQIPPGSENDMTSQALSARKGMNVTRAKSSSKHQ